MSKRHESLKLLLHGVNLSAIEAAGNRCQTTIDASNRKGGLMLIFSPSAEYRNELISVTPLGSHENTIPLIISMGEQVSRLAELYRLSTTQVASSQSADLYRGRHGGCIRCRDIYDTDWYFAISGWDQQVNEALAYEVARLLSFECDKSYKQMNPFVEMIREHESLKNFILANP